MPKLVKDIAERVVATYIEAFLGLSLAGGVFDATGLHLTAVRQAAIAAIPAALALLKGLVATYVGNRSSASTAPGV